LFLVQLRSDSIEAQAAGAELPHALDHVGFAVVMAVGLAAFTTTVRGLNPVSRATKFQDDHRLVVLSDAGMQVAKDNPKTASFDAK